MSDPRRGARSSPTDAGLSEAGAATLPFSQMLRLADLPGRRPSPFRVEPDAAARRAIADWLDAAAVPRLRLSGRLVPVGRRDWQLEARLEAEAEQLCVVTLEPVRTRIDEAVARLYAEDAPAPESEESEIPANVDVEPLVPAVDLGAVMLEALELALPLYPRAPGAELPQAEATPPGAAQIDTETRRPFAGLAGMIAKKDGGA